jgi:hypothetical protein
MLTISENRRFTCGNCAAQLSFERRRLPYTAYAVGMFWFMFVIGYACLRAASMWPVLPGLAVWSGAWYLYRSTSPLKLMN